MKYYKSAKEAKEVSDAAHTRVIKARKTAISFFIVLPLCVFIYNPCGLANREKHALRLNELCCGD